MGEPITFIQPNARPTHNPTPRCPRCARRPRLARCPCCTCRVQVATVGLPGQRAQQACWALSHTVQFTPVALPGSQNGPCQNPKSFRWHLSTPSVQSLLCILMQQSGLPRFFFTPPKEWQPSKPSALRLEPVSSEGCLPQVTTPMSDML